MAKDYLIDTHAHVDMYEDYDSVIKNAERFGVKKIIIPGVEEKDFEKIISISNSYENIFCQLGLFPSEAKKWNNDIKEKIKNLAKNKKVVDIGEIGLDYYWDKTFVEEQKSMFKEQIILANDLNLPVVVHDREAHLDCFNLLKQYNKNSKVLFHCFSGSPEFAQECLKEGWYIALGGVTTFKNAKKTKEVAKIVPLDKLVLETDSPYLTPVPHRGEENQPAYVTFVAEEIAKLRGITFEEVVEKTTETAERLFEI